MAFPNNAITNAGWPPSFVHGHYVGPVAAHRPLLATRVHPHVAACCLLYTNFIAELMWENLTWQEVGGMCIMTGSVLLLGWWSPGGLGRQEISTHRGRDKCAQTLLWSYFGISEDNHEIHFSVRKFNRKGRAFEAGIKRTSVGHRFFLSLSSPSFIHPFFMSLYVLIRLLVTRALMLRSWEPWTERVL